MNTFICNKDDRLVLPNFKVAPSHTARSVILLNPVVEPMSRIVTAAET